MNEILKMILDELRPFIGLVITAGVAYLVALLRKKTSQIQQQIDNQNASKYMSMASDAVAQAVT